VEAGLRIGVGTDSTGTYREELAALVDAGMSAEQVVRAATVDGAAICRVETPRMEPGSVARFCLYDHDPRGDVTRLVEPVAVVSGRRYHETAELGRLVQEGSR
jgi:imidazolonepropionase-like amidohydrolase